MHGKEDNTIRQGNMTDKEDKSQSMGTVAKMEQMTELLQQTSTLKNSNITADHKFKKLGKDGTWLTEKKKSSFHLSFKNEEKDFSRQTLREFIFTRSAV